MRPSRHWKRMSGAVELCSIMHVNRTRISGRKAGNAESCKEKQLRVERGAYNTHSLPGPLPRAAEMRRG